MMKIDESFIRNAEKCVLGTAGGVYIVGDWNDEYMYFASTGDRKWRKRTTDSFFDSYDCGQYVYCPVSAEKALDYIRRNDIGEDVED